MSSPRINYAPRPDATPESEISALSAVYKLALDSAMKRGRLSDECGPDDAKLRSTKGVSDVEQQPG